MAKKTQNGSKKQKIGQGRVSNVTPLGFLEGKSRGGKMVTTPWFFLKEKIGGGQAVTTPWWFLKGSGEGQERVSGANPMVPPKVSDKGRASGD